MMTTEELLRLPAVVDLPTAADVLGVGHSSAYELVRTGQCQPLSSGSAG